MSGRQIEVGDVVFGYMTPFFDDEGGHRHGIVDEVRGDFVRVAFEDLDDPNRYHSRLVKRPMLVKDDR